MTAIVGLIDKGDVYIGGDSAGVTSTFNLDNRIDSKVFLNGPFVFGFTTSFRMGQLLRYSFKPPKQKANTNDFAFMCTDFINGVRDCLALGGFAKTKDGEESGGDFLVGYKGHLYLIQEDYQVGEMMEKYAAAGAGADICLGSMYTSSSTKLPPAERIIMALNAAVNHNAAVRPPFNVEILRGK